MNAHRMLFSEQAKAAHTSTVRTVGIAIFALLSLLIAFVVWGLMAVDIGFDRGVQVERERQSRMPTKAPANCTEWLRQCADQALSDRFKPLRRKST